MSEDRKKIRRREREIAFRAIFQMDFQSDPEDLRKGMDQVLTGDAGFETEDGGPAEDQEAAGTEDSAAANDYAVLLAHTVLDHAAEIDETISAYLRDDWSLQRIPNAEKAILRLSAAEMIFIKMPREIAINEAVELAKQYGSDDAKVYINGILNNLAKDHAAAPPKKREAKTDDPGD